MTQEDKELLLKDLCARLLYGVKLLSPNGKVVYETDGNTGAEVLVEEGWKMYLRPMSSMTEEEEKEYKQIAPGACVINYIHIPNIHQVEWLNAHHFDYRCLIEKGLAIEAPEGMYKTE